LVVAAVWEGIVEVSTLTAVATTAVTTLTAVATTAVNEKTWGRLMPPFVVADPTDGSIGIACVVGKKKKTRKRAMRRGEARKRKRVETSQRLLRSLPPSLLIRVLSAPPLAPQRQMTRYRKDLMNPIEPDIDSDRKSGSMKRKANERRRRMREHKIVQIFTAVAVKISEGNERRRRMREHKIVQIFTAVAAPKNIYLVATHTFPDGCRIGV